MLPSRLLLAPLLSLALGCASAPPPPAEASIPAASAETPHAPAPEGPRESPEARARLDKWEKKLAEKWEIERRGFVGRFSFVIAHSNRERTGAIATADGIAADLELKEVWKELRDIDGDGRPDLVAIEQARTGLDERIVFAAFSDRPEGPTAMPIEGLEAEALYQQARWVEGSPSAIELGFSFAPTSSQIFAWNGHAFAPRDLPFFYLSSRDVAHAGSPAWDLVGIAHGKRFERSLDPGTIETLSGDTLLDLGDGPRFIVMRWTQGFGRGMSEEDLANPSQEIVAIRLDAAGFQEVDFPSDLDFSSLRDRDGDKIPEYERGLPLVIVAPCPPQASEGCQPPSVSLSELVIWSGNTFVSEGPRLVPANLAWAAEASKEAATLKDDCPIPLLNAAMQVYMGLRRGGKDKAAAKAEAERLLKGASTAQCSLPGAKARSVASISKEAFQTLENTISPPPKPARKPSRKRR